MGKIDDKQAFLQMWIDRMWNENRSPEEIAALFDEYWAEEASADGVGGQTVSSREAALALVRVFRTAFADIHFELYDFHEFDDCVGAYARLTMTHRASNSPIDVRGHLMARIRNDRIVEGRNSIDFVPVLEQMGVLPPESLMMALMGVDFSGFLERPTDSQGADSDEDDVEEDGRHDPFNDPSLAHPRARELMPDEALWCCINELAPFGSDEGAEAYYEWREWRSEHPGTPLVECLWWILDGKAAEYSADLCTSEAIERQLADPTASPWADAYDMFTPRHDDSCDWPSSTHRRRPDRRRSQAIPPGSPCNVNRTHSSSTTTNTLRS